MKRKNRASKDLSLSLALLLICSFASPNHGALENDLPTAVQQHTHIKEVVLKSFEIDDHVIDCINIYKQPAFQHPLLVNHTLQLKPNYPGETNDYISKASPPRNTSKSCPKGSIPIERMQRIGHFRGNLSTNRTTKHPHYFRQKRQLQQRNIDELHEYRCIDVGGETFYGVKASINVWNPKVPQQNGFSRSQVWVVGGDNQNILEAGWLVHPHMFGGETRFFTYWTTDRYTKTGCYNLGCPGFIQTNPHTTLDANLRPVSVYGGPQYSIDIEIFKDKTTENWWLRLQGADMGYWPKQLFTVPFEGANRVTLGGEVAYFLPIADTGGTEMGSGHIAEEGFKKSSFIKNIQVLDTSNVYKDPPDFGQFRGDGRCYDMDISSKVGDPWGQFFFYGGPGRFQICS